MTNDSQHGIHDYVDIAVHNVKPLNPCSYESLIKIMDHLKRICNVDNASSDAPRKWLLIFSDGV